ncbi:hypothetical protein GNI_039540 [Gregarina niphandrodes]|uniref:Uncharacterized protein n=1 Tax=Gregarina niphandrodes TaxID=110365 RepID=A0A023BAG0_GRENI|nr:hypothetical protein GNI_039540 [Gregarina niphandrodes]EZG78224.1 hypothetical protein GNI_039540 [Gregarina niphandrodes]|eukprot:XP_011129392.1 hypothetical protein GNI_039540 [Gregarina niphandrodes]
MKTIQCNPAEFGSGIVGVLAVSTRSQASALLNTSCAGPSISTEGQQEGGRATAVEASEWARDIWRHSIGQDLKSHFAKNRRRPVSLFQYVKEQCSMPGPADEVPQVPFLTRRQVEEYEQRHAHPAALKWLHHCDHRFSPQYTAEVGLQGLRPGFNVTSYDSDIFKGRDRIKTDPGETYPEGLEGSGRIQRSVPALVLWAYFTDERAKMPFAQRLRNLSVLMRWYPAEVTSLVVGEFLRQLESRTLKFPTGERLLQNRVALWLSGYRDAGNSAVKQSMVTHLAKYLEAVKQDAHETVTPEWTTYTSLRRTHRDATSKRFDILTRRYTQAYEACKDRLLSAYFPVASPGVSSLPEALSAAEHVPQFPVGGVSKISKFDDYQDYELRQWAWMEELLVRTLLDKLVSHHATKTGQDRNVVAQALRGPNRFALAVSQDEIRSMYSEVLTTVATRAAAEQAHDYGCRILCAATTSFCSPPEIKTASL